MWHVRSGLRGQAQVKGKPPKKRDRTNIDMFAWNQELKTKIVDLEKEVANLQFELLHKDRERRFWAAMFHAAKTYVAHAIKQEDMMGKDPG